MNAATRIAIVGYGNLGRGVEAALAHHPDMQLVGIFTRRDPQTLQPAVPGTPVHAISALPQFRDVVDVAILCGGSKDDLPQQGPALAAMFHTVDSFDTHAAIPTYFAAVDSAARAANKVALISIGWDPGLFSLQRLYGEALLPAGATYTFWGKGVSQGHSDAIRRVPGVQAGVQYTIPIPAALEAVRSGQRPTLSARQQHRRECYVVLAEGADAQAVEHAIATMPNYFADYDTTVHFVDAATLQREHGAMPHGGLVLRSGNTSAHCEQVIEYGLKLSSNPEFTASVLVAYARAVQRLSAQGASGAKTIFDIPPALLSSKSAAQLRAELL